MIGTSIPKASQSAVLSICRLLEILLGQRRLKLSFADGDRLAARSTI
jgi:hypothetical protein